MERMLATESIRIVMPLAKTVQEVVSIYRGKHFPCKNICVQMLVIF